MFTDMDIAHMKNFGLHRQTRADSDPNGLDDPTEPGTEPFRV
jgi:hypothetical protein